MLLLSLLLLLLFVCLFVCLVGWVVVCFIVVVFCCCCCCCRCRRCRCRGRVVVFRNKSQAHIKDGDSKEWVNAGAAQGRPVAKSRRERVISLSSVCFSTRLAITSAVSTCPAIFVNLDSPLFSLSWAQRFATEMWRTFS